MLQLKKRIQFYTSVNWIKTVYFNFMIFPFRTALKLPVFLYGRVRLTNFKTAKIRIESPIEKGMIGIGQSYETNKGYSKKTEINISGVLVFKGYCQFAKDVFVYVGKDAYCEFGHMVGIGHSARIECTNSIILGDYARISYESQLIDSNFHEMIDVRTGTPEIKSVPVKIGAYNYVSNRVSILKGTVTPDYCTIASNSLCNKNYSNLGENIVIGGIPAKLLKTHITRDWNGEKLLFDKLKLKNKF